MGFNRKFKESKSVITIRKSPQSKTGSVALSLIAVLNFISCTHKTKSPAPLIAKTPTPATLPAINVLKTQAPNALSIMGANSSPQWASDGRHLLYSSQLRASHKNSQIYEYDFNTNSERRITFSDGETLDPHYIDEDHIIYASTTDEIKEHPYVIQNLTKQIELHQQLNTEIYTSQINGLEIHRLTQHPGFDGLLKPGLTKQDFYFSSAENGHIGIIKLHLNTSGGSTNTRIFPNNHDTISEFVASHEHYAWISVVESQTYLFFAEKNLRKPFRILLPLTQIKNLSWAPGITADKDLLILTGLAPGSSFYGIYVIDFQKSCLIKLASANDKNLIHPSVSPDQKLIAYVASKASNEGQIFVAPFNYALSTCSEKLTLENPPAH